MQFSWVRALRIVLQLGLPASLAACGHPLNLKVQSSTDDPAAATAIAVRRAPRTSITLHWSSPLANTNGTALHDLAGYRIYSGTAADALDLRATLRDPALSSYMLDQLSPGESYFAITAFNTQGTESERTVVYLPAG